MCFDLRKVPAQNAIQTALIEHAIKRIVGKGREILYVHCLVFECARDLFILAERLHEIDHCRREIDVRYFLEALFQHLKAHLRIAAPHVQNVAFFGDVLRYDVLNAVVVLVPIK